jgi:tRNA(fMet)-specific endonuclease VapC
MTSIAYIFDSDTFTHYTYGHSIVAAKAEAQSEGAVGLSAITLEESLTGWYSLLRKCRHPEQIEHTYHSMIDSVKAANNFELVNYSVAAIRRYETLAKLKLNVGKNDLRIAAIALECGATVVTANVRDFSRVPDLKVEDWTQ